MYGWKTSWSVSELIVVINDNDNAAHDIYNKEVFLIIFNSFACSARIHE